MPSQHAVVLNLVFALIRCHWSVRIGKNRGIVSRLQKNKISSCSLSAINNNNNNNHHHHHHHHHHHRIQRRISRFFTISSLRRELSPTRTLKWPRHNRVKSSSTYHVQRVVCHLVRRDSSAIRIDRVEIAFILAFLYWLNPLTDIIVFNPAVPLVNQHFSTRVCNWWVDNLPVNFNDKMFVMLLIFI